MKVKALGHYVVIEKIKEGPRETEHGLIITEKQQEDVRYVKANVKSVGQDVLVIQEGDVVYFDKNAGHYLPGDEGYGVVRQMDIVGIESD